MKKLALYLLVGCLALTACYDEGELKPSEEPELIYGKYTLPQGNHDYDDDIVKFYNDYASLILYKFTSKDFGWSPTGNVDFDVSKDTVVGRVGQAYDVCPANEEYVGMQLKLLNKKWFSYLSDTLKQMLPQRILLCGMIDLVEKGSGHLPTSEERVHKNVYSGFYHMAVNWGDEKILTMSQDERNQFKIDVCTAYFDKIKNALGSPESFFLVTKYSNNITADKIYENGILDAQHCSNKEYDWFDYIKLAIANPISKLEGEGGVLNPAVDVNGLIRQKYDIMVNFFKTVYKFDIQAIGNDVE